MEHTLETEGDFSDVVETLTSLFGDVISNEVILAVVESYAGDLNLAAEAIMGMSSDFVETTQYNIENQESEEKSTPETVAETNNEDITQNIPSTSKFSTLTSAPVTTLAQYSSALNTTSSNQVTSSILLPPQTTMSYAGASKSTGAVPKQISKPRPPPSNAMVWTNQLRQLMIYHNQGTRILIILRGLPGSGKSYVAKQIVEMMIGATHTDYRNHIFSTDDYFMVRGQYQYDRYKLSEAHEWNQNRVRLIVRQGVSPVIIDNTNVEIWEMEPYVREGVKSGYIVEVVEPNTPWAKKISQLLRKNSHNVPATTIKRMLQNYQDGITGSFLIKHYGLSYPGDKVPPVPRSFPEFVPPLPVLTPKQVTFTPQCDSIELSCSDPQHNNESLEFKLPESNTPQKDPSNLVPGVENLDLVIESPEEEEARQQRYTEIQKQLEEMEKVEQEWENGEGWEDDTTAENAGSSTDDSAPLDPRPPRRMNSDSSEQSTPREKLLETVQKYNDWSKIAMFMPSWTDPNTEQLKVILPDEIPVREIRSISSSTCMEIGDTDLNNPEKVLKVVTSTPRDINIFFIPRQEKIPNKRMLDKGTMTNELLITEAFRCKNEEQHFIAFRKMFKNIPKASLRDIFDKCCGDVNWAVDIVLGGMADNQLDILEGDDISDMEEDSPREEQCNCLAAYQIIPDSEQQPSTSYATSKADVVQNIPNTAIINNTPQKKSKISTSESTMQLKRDIEKNVQISDEHYSKHTLKIRKWRRGEIVDENFESVENIDISGETMEPQPGTSSNMDTELSSQIKNEAAYFSDGDESNTSSLDDAERTINVNLGFELIAQLDNLFGRRGMAYPSNVVPRVNIPISLLNEINAFWMESLMCQLDEHDKQNAKMVKEDEEFARQLEMKEAELAKQGKEPEVPDFKEIMDMDFAISLYQKDVAEWKNKEPTDMAAKLSRDKLFNLFPDMDTDILSELLMAHDNNFQATVEVLLMSTGNTQILEKKNGLNKFVMEKEMERQEKLLEEEKKAISEVKWPLLPKGEKVEMSVVNGYREEAEKHLVRRNQNYQKAQEYIRRGMTQVANYYSDIASFHKSKYEQASSLAAASLMQVHASNSPDNATIDLHYLRVGEAKESLDLFLDTHIQKLKECSHRGIRSHTVYLITGRGLHSGGKPRVKPAVKKRLRERGLPFKERNPGLLTTKVCADDKLSYQVKVP